MSWKETLLDGSWRAVPLNVMNESLQATVSLARHGTPYTSGDSIEDLGRGAREFSLRVVIYGDNYEWELQQLLTALETSGTGELIHPIYGSVSAVAQNWSVQHTAERPDYCEVNLLFVEQQADTPFFDRAFQYAASVGAEEEDAARWQDLVFDLWGRIDSLASLIQQWIGGGWVGALEKVLGLPGVGLRIRQLRSQILGVVSGVKGMVGSESTAFDPLDDLARTPSEIRDIIEDNTPTDSRSLISREGIPLVMPGGDSLTAEADRAANALLDAARQGRQPDSTLLPEAMPTDPLQSTAWGLVILVITEMALAYARSVAGVIETEADNQTLSPDEIESLTNMSRSLIQGAILLQRRLVETESAGTTVDALRTMAQMIQGRARQVILMSPPLIERELETAACLRLLAHRWYGDHNRALELLRLNPGLRTPENIPAGTVLKAYAQ